MASPSPICLVNGLAAPQSVPAGSTVTVTLGSLAGVRQWILQATSTDELNTTAAINATLSINQATRSATFTAPSGLGSAVIFTSTVGVLNASLGQGYDANGNLQASLTTTFKVNVLSAGGLTVLAANEASEQNLGFGWIGEVNAGIRAAGGVAAPITLTGAVTGSGTGTVNTTLAALSPSQLPTITLSGAVTGAASGGTVSTSLAAAQLPTITLTGQVTGAASGGSVATSLTSANLPAITLTGAVTGTASGGTIATAMSGPAGTPDTIAETTNTSGTGTLTLLGAFSSSYQSFATAFPLSTTQVPYCISGLGDWEIGIGTYTLSGTKLSRDQVLASTNGGALVSLAGGTHNVTLSPLASITPSRGVAIMASIHAVPM